MQVQQKPQRLAMQPNDFQLKPLEAQSLGQGRNRTSAMAVHEINTRKIKDDIIFCCRKTINVGPDITHKGFVEVSV